MPINTKYSLLQPGVPERNGFTRMSVKRQGMVGEIKGNNATSLTWLVNVDWKGLVPTGLSREALTLTKATTGSLVSSRLFSAFFELLLTLLRSIKFAGLSRSHVSSGKDYGGHGRSTPKGGWRNARRWRKFLRRCTCKDRRARDRGHRTALGNRTVATEGEENSVKYTGILTKTIIQYEEMGMPPVLTLS